MQEVKTETVEKEEKTKAPIVGKVEVICQELQGINNSIISKAQDNSTKDIGIQYGLDEMPKEINTAHIKIVSSNYETQKVRVTFYRGYINQKVSEIKQLSKSEFIKIRVYVEDEKLFQAFNLWVQASTQSNRGLFLES